MREFDCQRAYRLLRLLSFPRMTGTEGEAKARGIIVEELESYGYSPNLIPFSTMTFSIRRAELQVTKPWSEEISAAGVGFSASTPDEGVEAELDYAEAGDSALLRERGHILLLSERLDFETYKKLMRLEPRGIVVSEASPFREPSHLEIMPEWRKYGSAPILRVRHEDMYRMLVQGAERARLTLVQDEWTAESFNVEAVKEGYRYPDEEIVICAHYDSVYGVAGSTDNAGGTAFLLELARVMASHKPKRTIRFLFFSGEELGLRGSLSYVSGRGKELEKVKMVVNLDVHGGAIGYNAAVVTGPAQLKGFLEAHSKYLGYNLTVSSDVYSSDGTSFSKAGVPSVSFFRSSGASSGIHTVHDDGRFTSQHGYATLAPIVAGFVEYLADAEEFPFPREIPEDIRKKVDDYFRKRLGLE